MGKKVITIGRQCGNGGRTIGAMVAAKLDIPFYDKRLIEIVSQRSGLAQETIEQEGEYHHSSLLYNIAASGGFYAYDASRRSEMRLPDQINAYQTELIKEVAENGPCVIVGRCADYILKDRTDCFHVFIHGTMNERMKRVVAEHQISADRAKFHIMERDRKRARYYKHITDQIWGHAKNYDLCLNSSYFGIDRCVEMILASI